MNISFANQVAFISGAADGLGFAAAQAFADAGAQVALADINERRLNEVAETLRAAGHNVLALVCDVADEAQVKNAVEQTVAHFGRLDAAYNNVGIHAPVAELAEAEGADFDRVVAVNLRGVWNCMKYQLIQMKRQGGGRDCELLFAGGCGGYCRHRCLHRFQACRYRVDQIGGAGLCASGHPHQLHLPGHHGYADGGCRDCRRARTHG